MSDYIKIEQVAERYGVSKSTIRRLQAAGRLPSIRVGRSIRTKLSDLERLEMALTEGRGALPASPPEIFS